MVVSHPAVAPHSQPPIGQRDGQPATLHSLVERRGRDSNPREASDL
jgi:hypothetical protein